METNSPSRRRQFLKESGVALLAVAGLAATVTPANAAGTSCVCGQGTIVLRRNNGDILNYAPALPATDATREAVLREALGDALDNDVVEISIGRCSVTGGALVDSLATGVTGVLLLFGEHGAIIYADPADAMKDYVLFPDNYRNVRWFGAHTYPEPGPAILDSWNAFQAARLSLPIDPASTGKDEENNFIRAGIIEVPSGRYLMS